MSQEDRAEAGPLYARGYDDGFDAGYNAGYAEAVRDMNRVDRGGW